MEPPKPRARPILVKAFHIRVPSVGDGAASNDLAQEVLGGFITMKQAYLTTFFVIQDYLHCNLGATGPFWIGL